MNKKAKWLEIIYFAGIVALIIGAIDPLEGSFVILAGSILLSLSALFSHDRHWKIFIASTIMIIVGVFSLFFISSLGGFGGSSTLSWWWGTVILPYPLGWLMLIILLITRAVKNSKNKSVKNSTNLI